MYYYGYKKDGNTPCKKRALDWEKMSDTLFIDHETLTVYTLLNEKGLCFPCVRVPTYEMSNAEILEKLSNHPPMDANWLVKLLDDTMRRGRFLKKADALTYIELCPPKQVEIEQYLEKQYVRIQKEQAEEARQEAERRKKEEEEERARKEREMEAVREKVLHGGTLEKEEFTYLFAIAAEVDYKIPLRTKGWLIKEEEDRKIIIYEDGKVRVRYAGKKTKATMPPVVCEGIVEEYRRIHA